MFPKMGPLWKETPISRALLSISFGIPSKEALPTGSPHRAPTEGDDAFPEPSLIHLSKSPVYEPPSRFPRPIRKFIIICRSKEIQCNKSVIPNLLAVSQDIIPKAAKIHVTWWQVLLHQSALGFFSCYYLGE